MSKRGERSFSIQREKEVKNEKVAADKAAQAIITTI